MLVVEWCADKSADTTSVALLQLVLDVVECFDATGAWAEALHVTIDALGRAVVDELSDDGVGELVDLYRPWRAG